MTVQPCNSDHFVIPYDPESSIVSVKSLHLFWSQIREVDMIFPPEKPRSVHRFCAVLRLVVDARLEWPEDSIFTESLALTKYFGLTTT